MALSFLLIVLFVGLRSRYSGSADTRIYCQLFETASHTAAFTDFMKYLKIVAEQYWMQEIGFYSLVWILSRITNDAQVFLVIITVICTGCVFQFISKHSDNYMLSCILYICLGAMTFAMNGMRQAMAMSICLLAYGFAVEKRLIPFLVTVALAMTFHVSAFAFMLVYPLSHWSKFHLAPMGIAGSLFIVISTRLASIYDAFVGGNYAEGSSAEGGGFVVIAIYLLAVMLVLLFHRKYSVEDKIESLWALCFVGFVTYSSRNFSTEIFERLSYYYFYFIILVIPKLSRIFAYKDRRLFLLIVGALAVALFAYRLPLSSMNSYRLFFMG